jgi:hypothetical protein
VSDKKTTGVSWGSHPKERLKIKGNVLFLPLNPGRIHGVKKGKNCMSRI